jgi:hypothetical protein
VGREAVGGGAAGGVSSLCDRPIRKNATRAMTMIQTPMIRDFLTTAYL